MGISVGGSFALLLLAVVGLIMSDNPWTKIASTVYLGIYVVAVIVSFFRDGFDAFSLGTLIVLVLLGMHAHGVHHMFDSKDRGETG